VEGLELSNGIHRKQFTLPEIGQYGPRREEVRLESKSSAFRFLAFFPVFPAVSLAAEQ
jgi:hypothetical protein